MNKKKITFFGDSICNGQFVSINDTFPVIIANIFSNSLQVTVSALNGETSRHALGRLYHDVLSNKPDILYVQYGLNDCNTWETENNLTRVFIDSFAQNMKEIVRRAFLYGVRKVILSTNHPTCAELFYNNQNKHVYNAKIRKINSSFYNTNDYSNSTYLVDHCEHWETLLQRREFSSYLNADGVHLNEAGHKLYAEHISDVILRAF